MKTNLLFTHIDFPLATLLDQIELGQIGLPQIQRPFVWPNSKVRDLFDSMYHGYPVGYLLFWSNGLSGGHKQIGTDSRQMVPQILIVDGQQRLTSLYAVVKGVDVVRENYQKERIRIAFRPRDGKFMVADATVQNDPEFVPNISVLWSPATNNHQFVTGFVARLKALRPLSQADENRITNALGYLDGLVGYMFTSLLLSQSMTEEQVAEVFVRINGTGTRLNEADFILTLMSVFWDEGRAALETFCRNTRHPAPSGVSPFNHFLQPDPDQLLRVNVGYGFRRARLHHVYSLLRGKDLETDVFSDELREKQFTQLKAAQERVINVQNWKDFLTVLLRAGYRNGDMITSKTAILYTYVLWLIGKYDYRVDHNTLREVMAQWFFASVLTGRYTGSPESRMEQDLALLREVKDSSGFVALWRKVITDTLTDDYWSKTLPGEMAVSSARVPTLFAYYAALNLLDARVLFSKIKVADLLDPAAQAKKSALERHHLFPRKYLVKIGVSEQAQHNQLANFALVEWKDNIEISDTAPAAYLPKYLTRFKPEDGAEFQPEDLAQMYYWHALPAGWEQLPYGRFLEDRRKRMAGVIHDAFTLLSTDQKPKPEWQTITLPDVLIPDKAPEPIYIDEELAPRHIMRREFWQALIQKAAGRVPLPAQLGKGINSWISVATGKKQLYWEYVVRMHDTGLALAMYRQDASENKRFFDLLYAQREGIEQAVGAALEWDRYDKGRGSFIRYKLAGGGLLQQEAWPEIQEQMIEAMERLRQAFLPAIQGLSD